jgi:hypothetical protein
MSKKVSFAPKPAKTADDWVQGSDIQPPTGAGDRATEKMKRFTIDVPASLHARIKVACAQRGTKMADEIRTILEKTFPDILNPT